METIDPGATDVFGAAAGLKLAPFTMLPAWINGACAQANREIASPTSTSLESSLAIDTRTSAVVDRILHSDT